MAAINSNGTGGGNWSAVGTWAGAAVPIEGDTVTILNGDTITIDQNITVGADTATAAIDVASGGKLEVLSTVAADYTLTLKGDLKNSSGGIIEIGTVANPIPAARIFTIKLNYSAALVIGKYGFLHSGDLIIQGDPARTTVTNCLLNADAAVDATGLTSDVSTGWKDNDKIAIASTSRTWSEVEDGAMNGDAVGTALTVDGFAGAAGGLANAHQGTDNSQGDSCRAEIINLTRNVKITSYNAVFEGYVLLDVDSTCDIDYAEFYELGQNAADKYGFVVKTTATSNTHYCSFYNIYRGLSIPRYYSDLTTFDHNDIYNTTNIGIFSDAHESEVITNNIVMKAVLYGMRFPRPVLDGRGNTITSCNCTYSIYTGSYTCISLDDFTIHSNAGGGYLAIVPLTIDNLKYWRNGSYFRVLSGINFTNSLFFGNNLANIRNSTNSTTYDTCRLYSEASYATPYGFNAAIGANIKLIDCEIGTDGAHTTADLNFSSTTYIAYLLRNTKLSSAIQVANFQNTSEGSYIEIEDLGQVPYADLGYYKYGKAIRDSSVKKTGSYSTRFDQYWAVTDWLEYEFSIPVKDGVPVVAACWLRKNASYTSANRPKIKLSGMGITETEDQMSDVTDTWEKVTVSGTPTRTGLAKLTIMTYLTNAGASAWCDFEKTGLTMPVLNTLEGSFWADGRFATILFDTGSITAAEFWKTLTADIDASGSFGNLFKDNLDAKVSGVPSDMWDEDLTYHTTSKSAGWFVRKIKAIVDAILGILQ